MAARIVTLLRSDCRSLAEQRRFQEFPFPEQECQELERILSDIGPECQEIYHLLLESTAFSGAEIEVLESRLRTELERSEESRQDSIEELERFLFRPVCFEHVWSEELEDIEKLRRLRNVSRASFSGTKVREIAYNARLCGLALSGGGVRSATFNLGLLQGMAKHGVLRNVDYLSTVSGGGYIGGWLAAWIKRSSFDAVEKHLCDESHSPRSAELQPITFLRDYSSYLTPKNGLFSSDTWTAGMTWLRNTFLNLIVLLSGLGLILLAPRLLKGFIETATNWLRTRGHLQEEVVTLIAISCQFVIILRVIWNLKFFGRNKPNQDELPNHAPGFGDPASAIQKFVIIPALLSAWLCASRLSSLATEKIIAPMHAAGIAAMVFGCFVLLMYLQIKGGYVQCFLQETRNTARNRRMARFLCILLPLITAGIKASLLYGVYTLFSYWALDPTTFTVNVAVWGIPLILADFAVCVAIHIGLMGRNMPDDRREWWSAVAAYLGIYAVAISALFSAAFYAPWISNALKSYRWGAALSWGLTTCVGVLAARAKDPKKPASETRKSNLPTRAVIAVAPYIFMIGLFLCVSDGLHRLLFASQKALNAAFCGASRSGTWCDALTVGAWNVPLPRVNDAFGQIEFTSLSIELAFFAVLCLITEWMSRAVNINEFSMHHFYRNRLIRTYLGASHCSDRRPNRLTGFDENDDLLIASLRPECEPGLRETQTPYTGPYPILNAALNLVHGERLSWQERKATSFIFTPKFCGYDYFSKVDTKSAPPLHEAAYRPASAYAYPDGGIHLGTAMAISGAAVSPNSGLHTSTPMAFLLTVLNVRLGWWMGNPRHDISWRRSGPRHGLMYLVRELFGMADDRQRHVYLSDGGHFENLGIYELVRRRCCVIIACDAEEDHGFSFDGLGGVIRKCFVDFGVRIDIDVSKVRPKLGESHSPQHSVAGVIYYPEGWIGTLIYIKSSLVGDEPADLQSYLAKNNGFPHQSTTEQFFEESQFESYHRLGLNIAKEVFASWTADVCEWRPTKNPETRLAMSAGQAAR